jgi:hypothetical protein
MRDKPPGCVGQVIQRLMRDKGREATEGGTARAIGIPKTTFSDLKNDRRAPTPRHVRLLCRYFDEPLATFLREDDELLTHGTGVLRWQVRTGLEAPGLRIARAVAEAVFRGEPPEAIATILAGPDADPAALGRAVRRVPQEVRSSMLLELVTLVLPDPREAQDEALAAELGEALSRVAGRPVSAAVVRDLAHPGFRRDPIAPYLIARVAHGVVAGCLEDHPATATIGIAGGMHVGAFVRSIGPTAPLFLDRPDRHLVLVPLTLEPFHDHRFELADALVGQLHARAASLLGEDRVQAPSFTPFGYFKDGTICPLDTSSIVQVRDQYLNLDVAVFGCGDDGDEGWIKRIQRTLVFRFEPPPVTDVCMHFIAATSGLLPYPSGREPLGVPIEEIRRLASQRSRLALLLASGESKGRPIALVARAGCTNAVVCDAAAARAALAAVREGNPMLPEDDSAA